MSKDIDYPYVRAWNRMMGSQQYYIDMQVDRARATQAPMDAIFEHTGAGGIDTGQWATIHDVTNPDALFRMAVYVPKELGKMLQEMSVKVAKKNADDAEQKEVDYLVDFLEWMMENNMVTGLRDTKETLAKGFRSEL